MLPIASLIGRAARRLPMTLGGDINAVLNRLVRAGVISAFVTNLGARAEPDGIRVTVTPASASN